MKTHNQTNLANVTKSVFSREGLIHGLDLFAKMIILPNELSPSLIFKTDYSDKEVLPNEGWSQEQLLDFFSHHIIPYILNVRSKKTNAHLHCVSANATVIADLITNYLNPSLDSWDQNGLAGHIEQNILDFVCKQFYQVDCAKGIMTTGGTQSNFLGLLLARNEFYKKQKINVMEEGITRGKVPYILCSELSHFTIQKSAAQLGIGSKQVIKIPVNSSMQMDVNSLKQSLKEMLLIGHQPMAIVATAGTTDFGSIDDLYAIAKICQQNNIWLHVDAAYGGGLIFSKAYKDMLDGISSADSIGIDFHKMLFTPISCGTLLLKQKQHLYSLKLNADYLNPKEDEMEGYLNLADQSLLTTRRFDALKIFALFKSIGKNSLGDLIDYNIVLTERVAKVIQEEEQLELLQFPNLHTVVFRFVNQEASAKQLNKINYKIRSNINQSGEGVIAVTKFKGTTYLKFTILNPMTDLSTLQSIIEKIIQYGNEYSNNKQPAASGVY